MVEVDPADPAFEDPTKFVGPCYSKRDADRLAAEKGWRVKADGKHWRRVVASPEPKRIFEIEPIRWLVEKGAIVICAGGGGIPTAFTATDHRILAGIEAVIDKDLASELLARKVDADLFVMATDADAVVPELGHLEQQPLGWVTPEGALRLRVPGRLHGAEGGGGVPVRAQDRQACGHRCLEDITRIVAGDAGTNVVREVPEERRG